MNDKMESDKEKERHKIYLSQNDFDLELPHTLFLPEHVKLLKRLGNWFNALENGNIKPITKRQNLFLGIKNTEQSSQLEFKSILRYKLIWERYKKTHKDWNQLYKILNNATDEEIEILCKILKLKNKTKDDIIPELINSSKNLLQKLGDDPSYISILKIIQKKLKLNNNINSMLEIEKAIAIKVLEDSLSRMSEEQKAKFEKEIIDIASKEKGIKYKAGSVFAALTAAQVSGFGVYLLATSTLSTLSGLIGLSLPFAAYTGLSSAISVIIGPVGWIGAGLFTLWKVNDINYNKIIPAVIYIGWLREKYSDL